MKDLEKIEEAWSRLRAQVTHWKDYVQTLLKWVLFSVVVGVSVGTVGAVFHMAIDGATELRQVHGWILYLLPVAGLIIVWAYHVTGMEDDKGTEYIIGAVREGRILRIRTAPLIFLGTVLTHLTGGSAGREGAALQLGGSMSNYIGRLLHLDEKDDRIITMCGMAAGFSALFGTPLAAAVMAMEVVSVGVMYYSAIVPCVLSALIAQEVAMFLGVAPTAFQVSGVPALSPATLIRLVIFGILCALVAILFCAVMHFAPKFYGKITKNPYLKVIFGGVLVVLLSLILGRDYNGAGVSVIQSALDGQARPEAFLMKVIFTALTLAAGFKGGEIVPAFFCGATFGCVYGALLGLPASFAAAAGMVAVFCGVTNCPLTSILLSYELFGGEGLSLYALCCAVSYMLSGYSGLYHAQKIVYSKLRPEYINRETH
jgi:H+/Cl- antiporter ClcA